MKLLELTHCPICNHLLSNNDYDVISCKNYFAYDSYGGLSHFIILTVDGSLHAVRDVRFIINNVELIIDFFEIKTKINSINSSPWSRDGILVLINEIINIKDYSNLEEIKKHIKLLLTFQ